jgi:ribosomal protein S12 methylthiotransferase accessory factor
MAMAATRFDIEEAMVRVVDEASSSRAAIAPLTRQPRPYDASDYRTFTRLTDGAVYYADPANRPAFDFMLNSPARVKLADLKARQPAAPASDRDMLDRLVGRFQQLGYELCVVDQTAGPVADCGLHTVRVVAPELLPLNVNYNLRYAATPRMFEAPARMGYPTRSYAEFNRWPQPFA